VIITIVIQRVRRHWSSSFARGLGASLLVVGLSAGCTSVRSNLGTSDSSCYLVLPAATHAVGSHSRLLGARLLTLADLRRQAPKMVTQLSPKGPPTQSLCVLAFSGHFTSTGVSKPHGRPAGPVAIVVLTRPSNELLGTVILQRVPLRFSHSHIG
jgi:hypothetical protein